MEDIMELQNRPPREWVIRAISIFNDIPRLTSSMMTLLYVTRGLRVLHTAAYEFEELADTTFDLIPELDNAILRAAPLICEVAPRDISKERVYLCLGAAASLVRSAQRDLEQKTLLTGYLRALFEAQVLWAKIQQDGDTIMRNAAAHDAFKYARYDGGWLH